MGAKNIQGEKTPETENAETEDQSDAAPEVTPKDERKFTQADVNAMLAKHKREMQKKIEDLQKTVKEKETFAERLASQQAVEKDTTPEPSDFKGQLELMEKRFKRFEEDAKKNAQDLMQKLEVEKRLRRETERDKLLGDALSEAQCQDHVGGRRYFLPQIELTDEGWMYRTKADNLVSIKDGIAEEMPNYLKPPSMSSGGSGSQGSSNPRVAAKRKQLDAEEAKLKAMYAAGAASGRHDDLMRYQKQKSLVAALRKEAATTK